MDTSQPLSTDSTGSTAPSRFTAQSSTAEDLLKSQTVGLVHLSDFRKRRAEALEQKEREAIGTYGSSKSGTATPNSADSDGGVGGHAQRLNKRKRLAAKGKLSFGGDDEEEDNSEQAATMKVKSRPASRPDRERETSPDQESNGNAAPFERKRLGPNASVSLAPKTLTKSALLKEAKTREMLRKEFLLMQEAVKATEIAIPFVFYDGTNIPGGSCKIKKGEQVWLFLDRGRKVGAEKGMGDKSNRRRGWARVGVDDLMLVRGEVIIPHHYEIYYFIVNKTMGRNGRPLFDYAATMDTAAVQAATAEPGDDYDPLTMPSRSRGKNAGQVTEEDRDLEGYDDDPTYTKVVDRRWYERNKHIFPASTWEEYEPNKDFSDGVKKDAQGNAFFFS